MRTIKIKNDVRDKLRVYRKDKESVDDSINRLLDEVEDKMDEDFEFGVGSTNIRVSDETMKRIKSCAVNEQESYGRILSRAFRILDADD
ncbi:MAG: hypothetical protein J6Y78_04695 [Paludibacteraceae bacterium]|nr:hypothetical protein [Paludibacteraceae bacterium]